MTPKRQSRQDIKNQTRENSLNNKTKNKARRSKLNVSVRKRRTRASRRKSNKLLKRLGKSPISVTRCVFNEYATSARAIPTGEIFRCMSHSSKNKIPSTQRRNLRSSANNDVISPTEEFRLCRTFATNERADGVRTFNIEVSTQPNPTNKIDENVSRDFLSLNLHDELNIQNNNPKTASKTQHDDNKEISTTSINCISVIEIPDSPNTKDPNPFEVLNPPRNDVPSGVENNDVICLDDTQLMSDDSDVVFVGSKRKSIFGNNDCAKRSKMENSVIIIDEDEFLFSESPKKKKRKLRKRPKKRITRSSMALRQSHNNFITTSTPNKMSMETQCIKCLCVGSHSCSAKPNLATIPEELGDKRQQQPRNNGFLNSEHQTFRNSLERTRSLLEYNNLDTLGSNFLSAGPIRTQGLRPIFIDGSNIAMGHANGRYFSVKGLKICIDYFLKRGHEVTAIVPMFRKKRSQNSDPALLRRLENRGLVVFTPARTIKGRRIVPYDDRYVVLMAAVHKGIVVSSDNFQDLLAENPQMAETIERRVLNPTWMKDMIIFPMDPLGRNGPSLEEFLQFP